MTSEPGSLEPGRPAAAAPTGQETRRLHPAGIAILAIKSWGSLWFAAVAIIAGAGPAVGIPIVLALLVVIGVGVALTWRVTTYAIVDGGLRYRTGLLSRREVDVPASRISALDTTRGILQRAFGVVALEVQTAGGTGKAEVVLHAWRCRRLSASDANSGTAPPMPRPRRLRPRLAARWRWRVQAAPPSRPRRLRRPLLRAGHGSPIRGRCRRRRRRRCSGSRRVTCCSPA